MQGLADSTTVTYNKLPSYLQPCNGNSNLSAFCNNRVSVSYTAATICVPQVRSTHQQTDEPHLSDCGFTPPPSDSTSSGDDASGETLFRPIDFDGISVGMCRSLVPLTPPESSGSWSSDRGSSNEDELPDVLLVRIPRRPLSMTFANNHDKPHQGLDNCCEPKPKSANATANSDLDLGVNCSGQASETHHGIAINLLDRHLWKAFGSVGNEMIVTKPGR